MTSADMRAWQTAMGFTQPQAAEALGMSRSGYCDLIAGQRRTTGVLIEQIDRRTALACAAIAAGLREWRSGNLA